MGIVARLILALLPVMLKRRLLKIPSYGIFSKQFRSPQFPYPNYSYVFAKNGVMLEFYPNVVSNL